MTLFAYTHHQHDGSHNMEEATPCSLQPKHACISCAHPNAPTARTSKYTRR